MTPQIKQPVSARRYFAQDILGREASKEFIGPSDLCLPHLQPEGYIRSFVFHRFVSLTTTRSPCRNSSHRSLEGLRSAARHSDARTLPASRAISGGSAKSQCRSCPTLRPSRESTRNASRLQYLRESWSGKWISINHRPRPLREVEPGSWSKVSALCPHESVLSWFRGLPQRRRRKRRRRSQDTLRS